MSNDGKYKYLSLGTDDRNVRIVTLLPGAWETQICCVTHVVSLDTKPEYETLSYAWGDAADSKTINLDSHEFVIRSNLEAALRYLRKPDEPLSLWADAICIDQQNTNEKNHQVGLMWQIYTMCSRVYIWLGIPDPNVDVGPDPNASWWTKVTTGNENPGPFSIIRHFADNKHIYQLPGFQSSWGQKGHRFSTNDRLKKMDLALQNIEESSWWRRLWCVQEALLPNDALIVFGHWRLSWQELESAYDNESLHRLGCCSEAELQVPDRFVSGPMSSLRINRGIILNQKTFSLERVLRRYRDRHCQDPHDKVYGIFALMDQEKHIALKPDYSLSLEELFTAAMKAVITDSKNGELVCLTGSGFNTARLDIPSWVRDLSLDLSEDMVARENNRMTEYNLYNACAGFISNAYQLDGSALILRGIEVDKVYKVGKTYGSDEYAYFGSIIENWYSVAGLNPLDEVSFANNPGLEGLWRTIIANASADSRFISHRLENQAELMEWEKKVAAFMNLWRVQPSAKFFGRFHHALSDAAFGRALFRTEGGHLGLCYPNTQPGDAVWIVHGSRVPFVLRADEPTHQDNTLQYRLLGDCYLHGFMDGEAVEDLKDNTREIVIV